MCDIIKVSISLHTSGLLSTVQYQASARPKVRDNREDVGIGITALQALDTPLAHA